MFGRILLNGSRQRSAWVGARGRLFVVRQATRSSAASSSSAGSRMAQIMGVERSAKYPYYSFAMMGAVAGSAGAWYVSRLPAQGGRSDEVCVVKAKDSRDGTQSDSHIGLGQVLWHQAKHQVMLAKRFVVLSVLFFPVIVTSPMYMFMGDAWKDWWFILLKNTLERAGPAFLKWGQWAATRPDLFSPDVCRTFELLQTDAPKHDFGYTKAIVEKSLGMPLHVLFDEFEEAPVASGSIAQVHRAVLSEEGARRALSGKASSSNSFLDSIVTSDRRKKEKRAFSNGSYVAVKVRHPQVDELIEIDFELMHRLVWLTERVTGLFQKNKSNLLTAQLKESLMQFGAPMKEQLDLRSEAAHLDNFAENFKWWKQVRFPLPATGMVTEDVLVETFEVGDHISSYLGKECPHNNTLANLGMTCYLKMLLNDNFIHADLHPGNILVHLDKPSDGSVLDFLSRKTGWNIEIPRIVLLDVGMTARLSEVEQTNLVSFFESLLSLDGNSIAESILKFADSVEDTTGFKSDMASLFAALEPEQLRKNTQEVVSNMMDAVREHGVQIPGVVSTVVITTMVLEGWSSKLNPDIRILESLGDMLPSAWEERMNTAIDQILGDRALALA
ncbi:Putative serine/threonine-protein kinase abkC [Picochlorum sp. SENEW3]|nr:Putative serine/threonine-protein kinase abkC [Picochlorum sp. SENEW3]